MKTIATTKKLLAAGTFFLFSLGLIASPNSKDNFNHLEYDLGKAVVSIDYQSSESQKTTIDEVQTALFSFSRNMVVNDVHIQKGEYEVSLKENDKGLTLAFEPFMKSSKVKEVQLDARTADMSKFINISLARVEDDKLMGSIAFEDKIYEFSMEVSLSNKIFAHFQKEQDERSADWLDYYQTAIYAYKHKINLEESYAIAQKALEAEQNEHTIELSLLYLEALGRSEEAQEFSALQEK